MSYVMVPVPEEHAEAVRHYTWWGVKQLPVDSWDRAAIAQLLRDFDEWSRALVVQAAEAVLGDGPLSIGAAAQVIGCSTREVLGLVTEVNHAIASAGGPQFVFFTGGVGDAPERAFSPETWHLNMPLGVAGFLLAAESAGA